MSVLTQDPTSNVETSIPLVIKEDFDFSGSIFRFGASREWWSQRNRTSVAGVIYVYTDYYKDEVTGKYAPGMKIGDGRKTIGNLPFVVGKQDLLNEHIADKDIHITAKEREYWNKTIAELVNITQAVMHDRGESDTEIKDGDTTSPIIIGGAEYYPQNGDVVSYMNISYMWNGEEWDQQGSAKPLGDLAYKNYARGTFLPHGHIDPPEFKGEEMQINLKGDIKGSVSAPDFEGTRETISVRGTPTGSVDITQNEQSINQVADVGTLPSCYGEITDGRLILHFDPGTLPTTENLAIRTDVESAVFTGDEMESSGDYQPSGQVSEPEFTGKGVNVSGTIVPKGTITQPRFHGTREEIVTK